MKSAGIFPVYIDSPLAIEATHIYSSEMAGYFDDETKELLSKGINPISFENLRVAISNEESVAINANPEPKIIISASGMCEAGRIRHHLKHNLWKKESTILFVGYQSEGTLGRKLLDGAPVIKLFGETISVNARIAKIDSFSSHADRNMLLNWLRDVNPQKVFVNHGEDTVCEVFSSAVETELGIKAVAPFSGDLYDLEAGECLEKAKIVKVLSKKDFATKRNKSVYERLLAALFRLTRLVEACRGKSNKELAKLTEQINNLCDKYEN